MLGSYRIDDVLGEGGMGVVYLAVHSRLDRRVAIKSLRPEYAHDEHARRRFFAEARAVNRIVHPNVIEVTDFVEGDNEHNYYVMELLEGVSLAELTSAGGLLALPRSIAIMTQVAEALAAVHLAGVVHRDVKPHNVLLIERGGRADFVKLVDFGIAKLVDVDDIALDPDTAPVLGTPKYMSPEQANGLEVDHRSDIYSFGVMLYELVTGQLPITGANFRELVARLHDTAPIPPSQIRGLPHLIPSSLDALILACLAKQPDQRPQHIDMVAAQLGAIADDLDRWSLEVGLDRQRQHVEDAEPTRLHQIPIVAGVTDVDDPIAPPPAPIPPPLELALPRPSTPPVRRRGWAIPVVGVGVVALIAAIVVVVLGRGSGSVTPSTGSGSGSSIAARVEAEIATADARIAAGRFVASGGDEALDHLLAARALAPDHHGVRERLAAIAQRFTRLADEAVAAGSIEEAAAHLQTVIAADPNDAAAVQRMNEIEAKILARQRASLPKTR